MVSDNENLTDALDPKALGKRIEKGLLDVTDVLHSINRHVELYTLSRTQVTGLDPHETNSIKHLYIMYEEKHSQFRQLWQKLVEAAEKPDSSDRHLPLPKTEGSGPKRKKQAHPNPESSKSGASISRPAVLSVSHHIAGPSVSSKATNIWNSAKWRFRRGLQHGDFQMKGELLYTRLNKLGKEFTVDLSALTHNQLPADRVDISILYGGKSGQLFPRISDPRLVSHGFDHWMIPNSQYHPFLPPSPGWPGLMLRSKGVDDWKPKVDGGFRVIIKREPSFFEYVGQYEMINLGNVSVEEWKAQPAMVKARWSQVVGDGQSWKATIARISLRECLRKEPSANEVNDFIAKRSASEHEKLARDLEDDVDSAFSDGKELIEVWGMKCVNYNFVFEKHLSTSFKTIAQPSSSLPRKRKAPIDDDRVSTKEAGGSAEGRGKSKSVIVLSDDDD